MKATFILAVLISSIFLLKAKAETADTTKEDKHVDIEFEANYLRHYIWRGANFGSNDVSQSFISAEYKKWSLNLGVNCNLIPENLPSEYYTHPVIYDEQDIQLTYADEFKKVKYECSSFTYFYFNQINAPSTSEFSLKLYYPLNDHFSIVSENVTDLWNHKKSYYTCNGLELTFTVFKKFEIDWTLYNGSGNQHFNQAYYNSNSASWMNYSGSHIEINRPLGKDFYAKAFVEYNLYTSKNVIDFTGINHTSNFGFSIGKDVSIKLKRNHLHHL
ncbi:MAG: hypothetical protein RJA07_441 [Bacteroidota bacterium]|jgi:hypothetical protein